MHVLVDQVKRKVTGFLQNFSLGKIIQKKMSAGTISFTVYKIFKGLVTGCHSFCLFFIFYNIHTFIQSHSYNTFIRRHSLGPLSITKF
jgi:hypothetical protein